MPAGRPKNYTPKQLEKMFDEYKNAQKDHVKRVYNNRTKTIEEINYDKPLTLAGFCSYARIHRDTLNSYKNEHEEFSDAIKMIYQECEADLIEKSLLYEYSAPMTQHILNNAHGYSNMQKVESSNTNLNTDLTSLSAEERQKRIDELMSKRNGK
ncbi:MAG: hypothetical protein GX660_22330 [Clostridiaceae bacterium]|nr:hypothetical protein [Clostridiaceae bacterium]